MIPMQDNPKIAISLPGLPPFDFEIHACVDRYISTDIREQGVWEPLETETFVRLCRQGDFVLDIGANIGWYSLLAGLIVGPIGRVAAFEPDPVNRTILERNLAANRIGNVVVVPSAVAASSGTACLYKCSDNLGDHRLFDDGSPRDRIAISTTTLDDFLKTQTRHPNIIKCDTQGGEWGIVSGFSMAGRLSGFPLWLVEFWPFGLDGMNSRPGDLLNWFAGHDYLLYELTEYPRHLAPTNMHSLLERTRSDLAPGTGAFVNLLAIPKDSDRIGVIADLLTGP